MALFFLSFRLGGEPGWMRASSHLPALLDFVESFGYGVACYQPPLLFRLGGGVARAVGVRAPRPSSCQWQFRICGSGPGQLLVSNGALGANVREDLLPAEPFDGHRQ